MRIAQLSPDDRQPCGSERAGRPPGDIGVEPDGYGEAEAGPPEALDGDLSSAVAQWVTDGGSVREGD